MHKGEGEEATAISSKCAGITFSEIRGILIFVQYGTAGVGKRFRWRTALTIQCLKSCNSCICKTCLDTSLVIEVYLKKILYYNAS